MISPAEREIINKRSDRVNCLPGLVFHRHAVPGRRDRGRGPNPAEICLSSLESRYQESFHLVDMDIEGTRTAGVVISITELQSTLT